PAGGAAPGRLAGRAGGDSCHAALWTGRGEVANSPTRTSILRQGHGWEGEGLAATRADSGMSLLPKAVAEPALAVGTTEVVDRLLFGRPVPHVEIAADG